MAQIDALAGMFASSLSLSLVIAAPAVAAALTATLVCGLIQSVTRLEEPLLGFVARLLAVTAVLLMTGRWMMGKMLEFTLEIWRAW